jgi:hypothetical protein
MRQATQIASSVVRGFLHVARLGMYRKWKVPYHALSATRQVRFDLEASWPQPSPISPSMPYAVLHLPAEEIKEFLARIVARFERQVLWSWLAGIRYLRRQPHLDCPDDATFARYFTTSVYAYFLTDVLDAQDRALLAANGIDPEGVRKADLSPVSTVEPFEGLYCDGSVVYLRQGAGGSPELLGAAMVDKQQRLGELIRPADGDVWKLAKMHVLQGATYLSLFVTHPKVHFPVDAVIAVTRSFLPPQHRIHRLLAPHMYLQLPLNFSVLHIRNAPGYNDPRLYYTAFSGVGRSQYRLFESAFAGLEGHPAYQPHRFGHLFQARETEHLRFLLGYREVILTFVRRVVADVEIDATVREWMGLCGRYTRGFGVAPEALDHEALAQALATLVWNCSVVHSSEHFEFHAIPMEHKPTRLRVPAPFTRAERAFDPAALTQTDDRLRHYMWHELYVRLWTLKRLWELDYQFPEPELQAANRQFLASLAAYDASLGAKPFIPLREIATSIQY